jgi:hypothetical protein
VQLPVKGIELRDHTHVATGLGWMLDDIDAGNADAAGGRQRARHTNRDRRALSSAIGTQQAKEFSALDGEVDALHRLNRHLARVGLCQLLNADDCVVGTSHSDPFFLVVITPRESVSSLSAEETNYRRENMNAMLLVWRSCE